LPKSGERRRKTAADGRQTTTAYLPIIAVQCPRRGVILQYAGEAGEPAQVSWRAKQAEIKTLKAGYSDF